MQEISFVSLAKPAAAAPAAAEAAITVDQRKKQAGKAAREGKKGKG